MTGSNKTYYSDHFAMYVNVESLRCTCETNDTVFRYSNFFKWLIAILVYFTTVYLVYIDMYLSLPLDSSRRGIIIFISVPLLHGTQSIIKCSINGENIENFIL